MGLFGKRGDLKKMLAQLEDEPLGSNRLSLLERAIAEATRVKDEEAGFDLRENLLLSSVMIGRLDRCIPAVEWCLAKCDAEPDRFDIQRILFQYKWIVEELPRHSEFARETIDQGIADLESRFLKAGWGPRGPLLLRMITSLTMADVDAARQAHEGWVNAPRDRGSDCQACEVGHEVRYLLAVGEDAAAINAAAPLLNGTMKCEEEPALTLSRMPIAYFETEQPELAIETMKKALDLCVEGHQFCEARARLMQALLLSFNVEPAVQLLTLSLPQALHGGNDLSILQTFTIGLPVIDVALKRGVEFPAFQGLHSSVATDPESVREWLALRSKALAAAFDERNGNSFYADFWEGSRQLAEDYPEEDGESGE